MSDTVAYTPGNIPIYGNFDLVVCGGGPAGIASALAAKRSGLKVLFVEGQGQLGGMGVSGLVSHWLGGRTDNCEHWVVAGIFKELAEECTERGFALLPKPEPGKGYSPFGWNKEIGGQLTAGVPFDPHEMAAYLDQKVLSEGIEILFMTQVIDVIVDGEKITHVIIFNKSGLQAVSAPLFVDSTGDADLAHKSGCETEIGRKEDRLMTPVTLQVHMDGFDQDAYAAYINKHDAFRYLDEIEELRKEGEWPFAYDRLITVQLTEKNTMMVNTPRITGIDGTDGSSVTRGMIQGRKEIYQLRDILRKHFPGCANVRVKSVAPLLGVRETRRIVGDFRLTVQDLVDGRDFPDTITFSAYGWDLPDPLKPSVNPSHGQKKRRISSVPFRTLIPRPIRNLIMAGRSLSVERFVLGPLREQAICMGMGEAAGIASSLALQGNRIYRDVDTEALRSEIVSRGGVVDYNPAWE